MKDPIPASPSYLQEPVPDTYPTYEPAPNDSSSSGYVSEGSWGGHIDGDIYGVSDEEQEGQRPAGVVSDREQEAQRPAGVLNEVLDEVLDGEQETPRPAGALQDDQDDQDD